MNSGLMRLNCRSFLYVSGILLLLAGVAVIAQGLDRQRPPLSAVAAEISYLPPGRYLKVAVLGYREMAADLFWLKAVQLLGEREQTPGGYKSAYYGVDVLTDLDPVFVHAYEYTGVILGIWADMPEESIAILKKGMERNPNVWKLPFLLGYEHYYELHQPELGAKYLRMASELPGVPDYLPSLAARMSAEAGDPVAALDLLQRLYLTSQDERLREVLGIRMNELVVERDIRFLQEAVERYKKRYGKPPASLNELVVGGIIGKIPEEPLGGSYELKALDGSVISTKLHERLRVYRNK